MRGIIGCIGFILAVILMFFVLTHISDIWNWLEGLFN